MTAFKQFVRGVENGFLWLAITGMGLAVGITIAIFVIRVIFPGISEEISQALALLLAGGLLGWSQWRFLDLQVRHLGVWILLSAAGLLGGYLAASGVLATERSLFLLVAGAALGGLVFGLVQAIGLPWDARTAFSWVGINVFGWGLALLMGLGLLRSLEIEAGLLPSGTPSGPWMVGALVIGLLMALAVVALFPRRETKDPRTPTKWMP
jgi:hypothetical protein